MCQHCIKIMLRPTASHVFYTSPLVAITDKIIMIISKYRTSNKYVAYILLAMRFVIIIGLISSIKFDNSNQPVVAFIMLIILLLLFLVLPIIILTTKKELILDKDVLTIKSNTSSDKIFDLREMLKWRFDDSHQRYQINHGIIQILKLDRKVLTIQSSEYDKFDDILKYFKARYSRKQVEKWIDGV